MRTIHLTSVYIRIRSNYTLISKDSVHPYNYIDKPRLDNAY